MYFIHEVERVINLHPSFFGHRIREYLTNQLFKDVEGTCDGNYYTICVVDIVDISDGKVVSGTGVAEYTIRFRCVVWKPFKGETIDCIVTSMNRFGFFCEAGPMKIFVSSHLLPEGFVFQPDTNPPQYADHTNNEYVLAGAHVRIKLMGTRPDQNDIFGVGSMKDDFLGVLGED